MQVPVFSDVEPWLIFAAVAALLVSVWIARKVVGLHIMRRSAVDEVIALLGVGAIGAAITGLIVGNFMAGLAPLLIFLGGCGIIRLAAGRLSMPGAAWLAIDIFALVVAWFWLALLISTMQTGMALKIIAMFGLTATFGLSLLAVVERIAREAVITHGKWRVPIRANKALTRADEQPMVSIHLACYAEPPEIVKKTMNCLAALKYNNFEVLVCDNNTKDEALWRPLERHAAYLNARMGRECFRFFHVAPLEGAKAGALNFCLKHMSPQAELVGVIDADYYSEPDFLARLAPFFQNRRVAYVQTPHDYRDFENNAYLSGCYWEYMPNNKVDMPGVSEYGGAFTIGTMCLLRTDVLRKVGGWAEWCLTEDSEVSVRLRAAGYHGLYLSETFGRGLIPDNFDDYKKQRFRWTAGPVQQLRRHWKLFMPAPFAAPMPGWTKLLEILRCVSPLLVLFGVISGLLVTAGIGTAIATGQMAPISVPNVVWIVIAVTTATWMVRTWHRYRLTGTSRVRDMVRGEVARAALTYVVLTAGVAGLSSKPLAWRRTPKFGANGTIGGAISSAVPETLLGVAGLAITTFIATYQPFGTDFRILASLTVGMLTFRMLCAPYMALIALRGESSKVDDAPRADNRIETDWAKPVRVA